MNFLVLATDYTGDVVAHRLQEEGQNVRVCNPNRNRSNGINLVSNIHMALATDIDYCICCSPYFCNEVSIIKKKGIKVFGGDVLTSKLELQQDIAEKFCKEHSIRILTPKIKAIYPLSIEVWYSKGEPLYQYLGYIKQNKFLAGDMGPEVDGESVLLWPYLDRNVKPVDRIFEPKLSNTLQELKFSGVMAFDTMVSSEDAYPYAYAIRPRLQAGPLLCLLELYQQSFAELIVQILQEKRPTMLLSDKAALALALSKPPYPYDLEGLVKYVVASGDNWIDARKNLGRKIREESKHVENFQYRLDGGMQGEYIDDLKRLNYINN